MLQFVVLGDTNYIYFLFLMNDLKISSSSNTFEDAVIPVTLLLGDAAVGILLLYRAENTYYALSSRGEIWLGRLRRAVVCHSFVGYL